ncbi:DUF4139 domain-containing protein [Myxococcus sp. K15C18031901]|uniref:DUF4139 domain-containing protein n=1 Tax=Myxococcus dinghuensis TaxID=2906761 RepID=UPI0020A823F7|nr:DUF4139 domain-containing protein [Myxococcus dinghuensis]MCP3101676.1 DUF4139 domain-containing protein [Myxococcus dinghuensis]
MLVVPSMLDAVTVYAEGALCTRLATLRLEEDRVPNEIRINGLPLSLRPGTMRAFVHQGPPGLQVRDLRATFDVQLPPEVDVPQEHRALEEALERLLDVTARLEALEQELGTLGALEPTFLPQKPDAPAPHEAPVEAMLALASFVDSELAALHARKLELERRKRDTEDDIRVRRQRIHEASSSVRGERARVYRAAVLRLSGNPWPREQPALIALEYAVPGARWVPTYDLRLPRTLEEGTLRMRASVLQRTGEDWTNVKVAVSTATLDRKAEVPELKALRIGRRQPPPPRSGWREPPPGLDELFAGFDTLRAPPPPPPPPPMPAAPRNEPVMFAPPPPAPAYEAPEEEALEEGRSMDLARRGRPPSSAGAMPRKPQAPGGMPSTPPSEDVPSASMPSPKRSKLRAASAASFGGIRPSAAPRASAPMEMELEAPEADMDDGLAVGGGGAANRDESPQVPSSLEPTDSLLDYDRLELAPAQDKAHRGRLRPRPSHVTRELLALQAVHVQVDILTLIAVCEQEVSTIWNAPLPAWGIAPRESAMHFDARFDLESRADVPSDAAWHTLPVLVVPMGISAEYVCVPSVESRAFRTVRLENRTPYPLLAGPVDVTLGDEFLMTSPLPTLPPGATQRLGLGVEESIKVARNTRFDEVAGGLFGSTMLTHQVSVELANRLHNRVLVEVCERIPAVPTGTEKDIKVEEAEIAPAWQKRIPLPGEQPVEGERAWRVVLQPGEAQTLKATWTVKIPANKMLNGGNRRT